MDAKTEKPAVDALKKPLIVGNWYGYSTSKGGWSSVTLGKLLHAKDGKARLTMCKHTTLLYGDICHGHSIKTAAQVSISAALIFPVPPQE